MTCCTADTHVTQESEEDTHSRAELSTTDHTCHLWKKYNNGESDFYNVAVNGVGGTMNVVVSLKLFDEFQLALLVSYKFIGLFSANIIIVEEN